MSRTEVDKPSTFLSSTETATEWAEARRRSFEEKANHNKNEALWVLLLILVSSTITPMFIVFGDGLLWGKAIPTALSLLASGCTAWLQVRRPQQLWGTYRDTQRRIEEQIAHCAFLAGDYSQLTRGAADKLLVERVSVIAFSAHEVWRGLVPGPESVKTALQLNDGGSPK